MSTYPFVTRLINATITGFAVLMLVSGCSSTSKLAQSGKGSVYLEEIMDWSFEASHPAVIDQVYGGAPPTAVKRTEYAVSIIPAGSGEVFRILSLGISTTSVNAFDAVAPALSVTCTVKGKLPAACGVPDSVPVPGSNVSPPV